jgi:hypothetical protein
LVFEVDYSYPQAPSGAYDLAYDIFLLNSNKSGPDAERKGTQKQPPSSYKGIIPTATTFTPSIPAHFPTADCMPLLS